MLTRKSVSTISYNTEEFLNSTLEKLTKAKVIEFWSYIYHKGEYDQHLCHQDKNHYHVYIQPNRQIDTVEMLENFVEIDPTNDKPLKCIVFRSSKFDDWLLYNLHDKDYLATKFEEKEYYYCLYDFVASDLDTFNDMVFEAYHNSDTTLLPKLCTALQSGNTFADLANTGHITLAKANQYRALRDLMKGV